MVFDDGVNFYQKFDLCQGVKYSDFKLIVQLLASSFREIFFLTGAVFGIDLLVILSLECHAGK